MDRTGPLYRAVLTVLAFVAVAVVWVGFIAAQSSTPPRLGGDDRYRVDVLLPTSAALTKGARVTAAGAQVGTVDRVDRVGFAARVRLRFDDEAVTPLPSDSRVRLRQHTPVGENYVSITVGKASTTLKDGATLPSEAADEYVDVDQILSTLQGETRDRARATIQSLGEGLDGRGDDLNRLVRNGSAFVDSGARVLDVVHQDRRQVSQLVEQLGSVATAIGERGTAIRILADRGLAGLGAVRASDQDLSRVLRDLPPTLERVKSTAGVLTRVSATATPTVDKTATTLRELQPVVGRLGPATAAARSVLPELQGAAPKLEDVLTQATKASGPLTATLPQLRKVVCEVAPIARYVKPYMPDPLGIVLGLGSGSNPYDATSHIVRLSPIVNDNSLSGLPEPLLKAQSELLHGGVLSKTNGLNWNFYMKPGEVGKTVADSASPIGPDEMPETGFTYPRVQADC